MTLPSGCIEIKGAKTHNLKNIDVNIPRNQLTVITGPSGSGKSSLAFKTLYAEGQRRYVESLSSYARQFLSVMEKPVVDHITGLSPSIAIEQKTSSHNPRSTVGTVTEIHDYLRLLFARLGTPYCPEHQEPLESSSASQITEKVMQGYLDQKMMIIAPMVKQKKGDHQSLIDTHYRDGFIRFRINHQIYTYDDLPDLEPKCHHDIDVIVDRLTIKADGRQRLSDSIETALSIGKGSIHITNMAKPDEELTFSIHHNCSICDYGVEALEPSAFSFNNPNGACPTCDGLGRCESFDPEKIIIDRRLSLAQGAIRGWTKQHGFYYQLLENLAEHYQFDLDTPYQDLPSSIQDVLLYGSGKTLITFRYEKTRYRSGKRTRRKTFEGVIPSMNRRYAETESTAVRQSLAAYLTDKKCPDCQGSRLNACARNVRVQHLTLPKLMAENIENLSTIMFDLSFPESQSAIATGIMRQINSRIRFLMAVGLNYLSLDRAAETLSGGETQRIRLASQIGSGLVGVTYVLDEPTIGLHQRDNDKLISTLERLRELGNSVVVVEHDEAVMRRADHIIDIGPGAGIHGGNIVCAGNLNSIMNCSKSLTGDYLTGKRCIDVPSISRKATSFIAIKGASSNNLQHVDANIPIGLMTCVTGVSGSGKSTLINGTLLPLAQEKVNGTRLTERVACDDISGLDAIDKVIRIDQNPIGRTPRSNPATYTGLFGPIRELFAQTKDAKARGYQAGRFSFNVKAGRCHACDGDGVKKVSMLFLADVYVTCEYCQGKRYNPETLHVKYKGMSIADVLDLTVVEAMTQFKNIPAIANKCQTLIDVGLGYIRLGQASTTLSGGEAQRIKLSRELSKRSTGKTLFILDEPTTGLHFGDVAQLLSILHRLVDQGNSVVIIEHNLDVIKTADWIIDLGPEGGQHGGNLIAQGPRDTIIECRASHTGHYLKTLVPTQS